MVCRGPYKDLSVSLNQPHLFSTVRMRKNFKSSWVETGRRFNYSKRDASFNKFILFETFYYSYKYKTYLFVCCTRIISMGVPYIIGMAS